MKASRTTAHRARPTARRTRLAPPGLALAGALLLCTGAVGQDAGTAQARAGAVPATQRPGELRLTTELGASDRAREHWDGARIVRESVHRHETFPYVYEEQTMVLTDGAGHRTVRKCRRFTRVEPDGTVRFLLVFDAPEEIRGVALLARRTANGEREQGVYLPAFGPQIKHPDGDRRSGRFLGTDLTVDDLTAEALDDHRYVRGENRTVDDVDYFVVDAYPASSEVENRSGYGMRRLHVRKDNLVIAAVDYYDRRLRFSKRLTRHDLRRVNGESWRANMIAVHVEQENHRTLLKVDRRVYSRDYVPLEIFEPAFLLANGHLRSLDDRVAGRGTTPPAPPRDAPGEGS